MIEDKDNGEGQPAPEGYLSTSAYSRKYSVKLTTLKRWIDKGFVEASVYIKNTRKQYYLPDKPPVEHFGHSKKQAPVVRKNIRVKSHTTDKVQERRKIILREKYLPLFLENAPPDQMVFAGKDVIKMLKINPDKLYRIWPAWGLEVRTLPTPNLNSTSRNRGGGFKTKRFYTRSELYRFLAGKETIEGVKTLDDRVTKDVLGGRSNEDGYYNYIKPAWPLDGDGVIKWIEAVDLRCLNKRTQQWEPLINSLRDDQKGIIRNAFKRVYVEGRGEEYKHRIIVISAPRGEGKTLLVAVMCLFRFWNMTGEVINLSGNNLEQASFAHYELVKRMILNTPQLKNTPGLDVKEKHITLSKGRADIVCEMKAIPTASGLLPNTTCAVFTELHNLQDRAFFINLWTSTRATPDAMVLVDTTVAPKGHIVHNLWENYNKGNDPHLYFYHVADKIYNPETTASQLKSFKEGMSESEFNKYFRNRWVDASGGFFDPISLKLTSYIGLRPLEAVSDNT